MSDKINDKPLSFCFDGYPLLLKKLGISGKAYEDMANYNQKLHAHTQELLKEVWRQIIADKDTDIVLIHGDLTNYGEKVSHEEFRDMLYELESHGKKVFLTYSNHDYNQKINTRNAYQGDNVIKVPSFSLDDIKGYYDDFGIKQALSVHSPTGSYVVKLKDNVRLLALNDDFGYEHSGYTQDTMYWIEQEIAKAQKAGDYVFAMAHHPIMPASPLYVILGKKDLIEDREKRLEQFADMGVNLYLTGHSHMQKIDYFISKNGNLLYNISTSALVGYPPVYRKVTIDLSLNQVIVKSHVIKYAQGIDTKGKALDEYLKQKFLGLIGDFVYEGKEKNMTRVKEVASGISLKPEQIDRKKWLIVPLTKWMYKLTYGKVLRYTKKETGLRPKDHKDIKDKKFLPVITNLIANIYDGNPTYHPDTIEYKLIMGLTAITDSVIRTVGINLSKKLGYSSVSEIVHPMVHNLGFNNYDITLDLNPKTARFFSKANYTPPYKSRKGIFITVLAVLALIAFSPALLILSIPLSIKRIVRKIKNRKDRKDVSK